MSSVMAKSRAWVLGRIILLLAAFVVVIALLALAASAQAAFPGANGKIAFSSNRDGDLDIYTMNADGSGVTQLTNNPFPDTKPAWSADGARIVFIRGICSTCDVGGDVWVMNADGTGQTRLISNPGFFTDATWSPDAQKIAFTNNSHCGAPLIGLNVMNADGSNPTNIACVGGGSNRDASWSPDGQTIVFSARPTDGHLWTIKPDGSGLFELTITGTFGDLGADWSPDGTKIAFNRSPAPPTPTPGGIYEIRPDGTGLTFLASEGVDPSWSPDGAKIAFTTTRDGNFEIYAMNSDGTGPTNLTNASASKEVDPAWQPINPAPYPRPNGASPMRISLVPAFAACDSAASNATHPAPLSGASCNPPVPRSSLVAVGPRSLGFARMTVLGSGDCAPFDSTHCYPDVTIRFNITDVRSGSPTGPDYSTPSAQDLTGIATLPGYSQGSTTQITDENNQSLGDPTGPYDKSATVVPIKFPVPIDCVAVANPIDGSVCNAQTTANTLVPGSAVAGKRAVWELGQLQVLDQGADGVPGNGDDQVFEAQGVFVP